jgi:CHAD domain-containing protein
VKEHIERELKLAPGDGFRLHELGGEPLPTRVYVTTYHDTPDLRLARSGVTFRHRVEDGTGLWQLKVPHGAARLELERQGPPARPPEELLDLLGAFLRGQDLVPVARLRTRREGLQIDGAEVVEDSVAVLEAQHVTRRFREVEVELTTGDDSTLRRLEKALRRAGAERGPFRSKLFRALDLPVPVERPELSPASTPREALAAAFHEQYERLLAHDPGTRLGTDPEDLHQLRVATRRLRAFLRAGRPLLERPWAESLRAELGWLGSALGPARDLDVLVEHLRADVDEAGVAGTAAEGLLASFDAERARAREAVVEALGTDRYLALLDRVEDAAASPRFSDDEPSLARIWWREWKRTRKAFRSLGEEPPDDELHAARIRVKRARYAAELAAHELGGDGERFVAAAKGLQDVLGEHQDAVVAEERIRAWANTAPGAADVAERLVRLERGRREQARSDWPGAWAKLERRARRAKP